MLGSDKTGAASWNCKSCLLNGLAMGPEISCSSDSCSSDMDSASIVLMVSIKTAEGLGAGGLVVHICVG